MDPYEDRVPQRTDLKDSPKPDGPCNPFSRCFHWCCTHCITQKPSNPDPKPKPGSGPERQVSANQKEEKKTNVKNQLQKTEENPSQVVREAPHSWKNPKTTEPSAAPGPSRPSKLSAAPEPSKPAPSAAPEPSKPAPSAAPEPSKPAPSAAPEPSKPAPSAAPEPSKPAPSAAPEPSKPAPSAAPEPSKPAPSAAPEPSKPAPSAESELERIRIDFIEKVSTVILKQLLDALEADGVVNKLEREAILEENKTRADTARGLIDSVRNKGEKACRKLIEHFLMKDPVFSSHLGLSFGLSAAIEKKPEALKQTEIKACDIVNPGFPNQSAIMTTQTNKDEKFQREFLDAHNAYRAVHHAPPLVLSSEMCAAAQEWADHLLEINKLESSGSDDGENTYHMYGTKTFKLTGREAVDSWYKGVNIYDFNNPGFQKNTGSFTQLVWKASEELGVGVASDGKRAFVIGRYRPAGNFSVEGYFEKNVLPKASTTTKIRADEKFQREFLDAHNAYRAVHHAPPLVLSSEMCAAAQEWADHLLEINKLESSGSDDGENTYHMYGTKTFKLTGREAVDHWYNNIKDYNFNRPGYQKKTGSFTQLVWKDSKELGVGMASNGKKVYVIGHYRPAGNVMGEEYFLQNVLPKGFSSQ